MAFRINTVEYGWETLTSAQSGSIVVSGSNKQVFIPETGSRTFLCVDIEMYLRDANTGTTIADVANYAFSCSVDGNLGGAPAATSTINGTDDHATLFYKQNFTNLFNTRFTGSSHVVSPRFSFPAANSGRWTGHSFKLIATYQFDDTDVVTNIKTVRLPLDTNNFKQQWLFAGAGGRQVFGKTIGGYTNIPAFDTFLPESTKDYKDIWIQYTGYDSARSLDTTTRLVTQIDSGSTSDRFVLQNSMASDTYYFDIQNVSGTLDTSTAHTLKASSSLQRFADVSPTVCITYTYRSDLSTQIMSSMMVPFNEDFYKLNTGNNTSIYGVCNFLIPELNPSMCHSAIILTMPIVSTPFLSKSYTKSVVINNVFNYPYGNSNIRTSTAIGGPATINHRFDSQAATSSNYQLSAGYNTLNFGIYGQETISDIGYSGYLLLNYSSSKLPSGVYGHNNIIYFSTGSSTAPLALLTTQNFSPTRSISSDIKTSYYMHSPISINQYNSAIAPTSPIFYYASTGSNGVSASFFGASSFIGFSTELSLRITPFLLNWYVNYPNQPVYLNQIKLKYFDPLTGTMLPSATQRPSWKSDYITYNQNINRVTGSLLNCAQTSVDYKVDIYLSGSNVPTDSIYNLTTTGSGTTKTFMFDWYESVNKIYAVAKYPESGISNFATASNGNILTIDYAPTGGSTEKSFTFIG